MNCKFHEAEIEKIFEQEDKNLIPKELHSITKSCNNHYSSIIHYLCQYCYNSTLIEFYNLVFSSPSSDLRDNEKDFHRHTLPILDIAVKFCNNELFDYFINLRQTFENIKNCEYTKTYLFFNAVLVKNE